MRFAVDSPDDSNLNTLALVAQPQSIAPMHGLSSDGLLIVRIEHLAALGVMGLGRKRLGDNLTLSELKSAYKKRALRVHPDKPGGSGSKFNQLIDAFSFLEKEFTRGEASSLDELLEELFTCLFKMQQALNEWNKFFHYFHRSNTEINLQSDELAKFLDERKKHLFDDNFYNLERLFKLESIALAACMSDIKTNLTKCRKLDANFENIHALISEPKQKIVFVSGLAITVFGLFTASISYFLYDKTPQKTPLLSFINEALFYTNTISAGVSTSIGTALMAHSIFLPNKNDIQKHSKNNNNLLSTNSVDNFV